MSSDEFDFHIIKTERGKVAILNAGRGPVHRVVPPAGEAHAFDVQQWARMVEVYVSPKGRSVRVWVDGREIIAKEAPPCSPA